ncbi:MAG: M48 family metallopeptidase [Pseudomonadota bacterium]
MRVPVWHYDGVSGVRQARTLVPAASGFFLEGAGGESGPFAFKDLVPHGAIGGQQQYGLRKNPGWRIGFEETPPEELSTLLPGKKGYGRLIDRVGLWPAVGVFIAISAVFLWLLVTTPPMLVRMIPESVEKQWGAAMIGDFGGRTCTAASGNAALAKLSARLGAKDMDIRVVDIPIVNAVTLPGGHILLFKGLLTEAESADEVAGVLAHEMGHVRNRDVLESLVRQLGLSMVLSGADGNIGGYTNALLSAGYSRSVESRADTFALNRLHEATIATAATASFFKRLAKVEVGMGEAGALLGYLSSHPLSSDRERMFQQGGRAGTTVTLDPAEWSALQGICSEREAPKERGFRF